MTGERGGETEESGVVGGESSTRTTRNTNQ